MLKNFADAWGNLRIDDDGTVHPLMSFTGYEEFGADAGPDGLTRFYSVASPDYEPCVLAAFFPMSESEALLRKKQWPTEKPKRTRILTVTKRHDTVGAGDRAYDRFLVELG